MATSPQLDSRGVGGGHHYKDDNLLVHGKLVRSDRAQGNEYER
ncbi:hypothetical protein [Deinococcus radiophilus]|nr:hypothetical protein [Deinococcus radiophilus]